MDNFQPCLSNFKLSSANSLSLEELKTCCLGKGKRVEQRDKSIISITLDHTCKEGFLMCQDDKRCISTHWKCDGNNDCNDGSDELNCGKAFLLSRIAMVYLTLPNDNFLDWSQVETTCSRQNKLNLQTEIHFGMGRKHCGKRRKCWLPAFSPFPTMFSKGFFLRVVKCRDCGIKGKYIHSCQASEGGR